VLIQTQENPQSLSLKTADLGDTVTLHCAVLSGKGDMLYWYKQSLGYVPQVVARKMYCGGWRNKKQIVFHSLFIA